MVPVFLVMHEPLGAAFARCAEHVLGEPPSRLNVVDIAPDADVEHASQSLFQQLMQFPSPGSLVLCDLYGATPFNVAQRAMALAHEQGVQTRLLTGTNLYMVLKALTDPAADPDELCASVRRRVLRGIVGSDDAT